MRYYPCICGGLADCSCGERMEQMYRRINPRTDKSLDWFFEAEDTNSTPI